MRKKTNITKEYLENKLFIEKKFQKDIAKELNCSVSCIQNYCKSFGIKLKRQIFCGQRFGKLLVVSRGDNDKHGHWQYLCECDCGNKKIIKAHNLGPSRGTTTSCGCSRTTKNSKHPMKKGCGEISGTLWKIIEKSAKKRKIEFNITPEYGWNLFLKQNRKCNLSELSINFSESNARKSQNKRTASLDRIDSSKGYVEGNVQWVHKDVNKIKMDLEQQYFIELCKLISEKNK